MATITHDLTTVDAANSVTGWEGWGNNTSKWDADSELKIEGSASNGCTPNATGESGWGHIHGSDIDLTANLVLIWVWMVSENVIDTYAGRGLYVRVTDDVDDFTTTYYDYYVGGSDVVWCGKGWRLICLDVNRGYDSNSGTVDLTVVRGIGVGFDLTATSNKSTSIAIDAIRYGSSFELTGSVSTTGVNLGFTSSTKTITRASGDFGSEGYVSGDRIVVRGSTSNDQILTVDTVGTTTMTVEEALVDESSASGRTIDLCVTLQDIYDWDIGTSTYFFGVVTKNTLGAWEINFPLTIGDVSGTSRTAFLTEAEAITFADQPLDTGTLLIQTAQDSGAVTMFFVGSSTGTGDSRVGFGGSTIAHYNELHGEDATLDLDAAITEIGFFGSTCDLIDGGVTFPNASGTYYVTTVAFNRCGQVAPGQVEARGLTFAGYVGAADGAVLWNENIDIEDSFFLANTRAIEHPSAAGTPYDYYGLSFSGNTYDVNNTSGSAITVNNQPGSNASSYDTGSSAVTFLTAVSVKVTVQDAKLLTDIQGARVLLLAATGGDLPFEVSVGLTRSGTTVTVAHTAHGLETGDKVRINGATGQEYNGIFTITYIDSGSYSYTCVGTPTSPDPGSPHSTFVILDGTTDANGEIEDTAFNYTNPQPVAGKVRKGTTTPLYATSPLTGSILSTGYDVTSFLVKDE